MTEIKKEEGVENTSKVFEISAEYTETVRVNFLVPAETAEEAQELLSASVPETVTDFEIIRVAEQNPQALN